jgi:hypothetical protein
LGVLQAIFCFSPLGVLGFAGLGLRECWRAFYHK